MSFFFVGSNPCFCQGTHSDSSKGGCGYLGSQVGAKPHTFQEERPCTLRVARDKMAKGKGLHILYAVRPVDCCRPTRCAPAAWGCSCLWTSPSGETTPRIELCAQSVKNSVAVGGVTGLLSEHRAKLIRVWSRLVQAP